MSEHIEVNAGPEGQVKCTFDGEALELVGYTAAVVRLPLAQLHLKRKKKPEKDGGQVFYFVSPLLSGRAEMYMPPAEVANMEKLFDALLAAGAKTI